MIIGEHNLESDMEMNAARKKETTNIRVSGMQAQEDKLHPPKVMGLEECIAYIRDDELVEVTPKYIRMRKAVLSSNERERTTR